MRLLRSILLIVFIITTVVFGIVQYRSYKDRDNKAPVISSSEETIHLSVKAKDEDFLKGVKAVDDVDGDVTLTLSVAGKSNFIEEGVIRVDYAAFDSHNNIGTYSRKIIFDDYHSPRFASEEPLAMRSEASYDFSFFSAEDVLDGDISNKIKILSDAYAATSSSEYPVEVEVTNNYGDVEKLNLVIELMTNSEYNRQYPALSEYIVYVPVDGQIDFTQYIIGIRQGDKLLDFDDTDFSADWIRIEDYVDYHNPGQYTVTYSLRVSDKVTTETRMIVIVTEDY